MAVKTRASRLGYDVFPDRHRSRSRRRLVIAVLATIIVLVALLVGRFTNEARSQSAYLDVARDQIEEIGKAATSFADLSGRLLTVDRDEFQTVMDAQQVRVGGAGIILAETEAVPELAAPEALLGLAVQSWAAGLTQFEEAILVSVDDPGVADAADAVASALHELGNGDNLYAAFAERLNRARSDLDVIVGNFPAVSFLTPDTIPGTRAASLVAVARLAPGLPLRSELAIEQVNTEPEWVTSVEGELVVVATEQLAVSVVVANRGNTVATPRRVILELSNGGRLVGEPLTGDVPELRPAASTVVSFSGLAVQPGQDYTLVARLELADEEEETDDNVRSFEFRINQATSEG